MTRSSAMSQDMICKYHFSHISYSTNMHPVRCMPTVIVLMNKRRASDVEPIYSSFISCLTNTKHSNKYKCESPFRSG